MKRLALLLSLLLLAGCTNVWVSPTGLDTNSGTEASPKRTLSGACQVPKDSDGRLVHVKAGTYPPQTVPASCGQTIFVNEGGAVTVKNNAGNSLQPTLQNDATNVAFDGINVDSSFAERQGFGNSGAALFKNASIGNVLNEKGLLSGSEPGSEYNNVLFHDVLIDTAGGTRDIHNECMYSQTPNVRIIDSEFKNCSTMDVMFTRGDWWGQPTYGGGVITGNKFWHPTRETPSSWHFYGMLWNGVLGQATNWTVKNNWFETRLDGGSEGRNEIGLDIPWVGGVRCGNTESVNGVIGSEWKVAC